MGTSLASRSQQEGPLQDPVGPGVRMAELPGPSESDNIECHLQQIGMGGLICRAARRTGEHSTNEVDPTTCFNCAAGKIFREVGCDAVRPKLWIHHYCGEPSPSIQSLFCTIRKRETTLEYCRTCGLAQAETTREIVSVARGLFETQAFHSAYKDIEKARLAMRDGEFDRTITCSIACVESVMRICHDRLGQPLPKKKQVSGLWKSTRVLLNFDAVDSSGATTGLMNALFAVISELGRVRNALGDAHGKGTVPPSVSETISELAINTSATLSTAIMRRFSQMKEQADERDRAEDRVTPG